MVKVVILTSWWIIDSSSHKEKLNMETSSCIQKSIISKIIVLFIISKVFEASLNTKICGPSAWYKLHLKAAVWKLTWLVSNRDNFQVFLWQQEAKTHFKECYFKLKAAVISNDIVSCYTKQTLFLSKDFDYLWSFPFKSVSK